MPRLIGAHMPAKKGIAGAVREGHAIGCTAVQVFTSSPQMWRGKTVTPEMVKDMQAAKKETGIDFVVSHDTYLVNLCSPDEVILGKSFETLRGELMRCSLLGIKYVVSHMGSHKGEGEEKGLKCVVEQTRRILDDTPDDVGIAMETTAGQGSALFYKFEHLAYVIDELKGHPRLGVCMDTCHLFSAGYAVHTEDGFEKTMKQFGDMIGFDRLRLIHANDSLKPFGEHKDRHAHIGDGLIGLEPFRWFVNDKRLEDAPLIIETPDAEEMHAENVKRLKSLVK